MKIVFLGTPRLAQIVLENLIASPYKPDLVITGPDKKIGRGQSVQSSPVKQTAQQYIITTNCQLPVSTRSIRGGPTTNYQFDLAILVAFGKIIPAEILNIPKYGFLNVHPSLLPKYRGPSPIQSAILAGDKKTGVTIIKLDKEVDHGPTLAQKEVDIENFDTHETLVEKLGAIGSNLLLEIIPDYITGKTKPQEQNHKLATITKKIEKVDGRIDLENPPDPVALERMTRAFYPWPTVWSKVKVKSTESKIIKFLPKGLVQMEGKRPQTVEQLKNGYPQVYKKVTDLLPSYKE